METQPKTPKFVQTGDGAAFEVLGATMLYKATAEDTGGGFSLAVETTQPGGGQPLHVHSNEDEAMYILEGEFEIQCGDHVHLRRANKPYVVFYLTTLCRILYK